MTRRPAVWATLASVATMLFVAILTGIPRSPLTPALPPGAGPLAVFRVPADTLGLDGLSPTARVAVAGGAMALAAGGFLIAIRAAWRGALPLAVVLGVGLGFHVLAVAVPLFNTRDVYQYAMYGRIAAVHGANPYVATPAHFRADPVFPYVGPEWKNTPAFYGPAFIELSEVVVRSVRGLPAIVVAFKAMAALASLATVVVVAFLARRLAPARAPFAAALLAWNPVVIFGGVAGGHNDLIVILAVALALLVAVLAHDRAPRTRLAMELVTTAVLAVGTMVKVPTGLILVVFVAVAIGRPPRGRRLRAAAAHIAVAAVLILVFVRPFMQARDPTLGLRRLAAYSSYLAPISFFRVLLARLPSGWQSSGWVDVVRIAGRLAFPLALAVVVVAVVVHLVRRGRDKGPVAEGAAWGWVLLTLTLAAPTLFPWYLIWALPLAWLLPRAGRVVVILLSSILPLFSVATDRAVAPHAYDLVLAVGVTLAAPLFLVVLACVLRSFRDRLREGQPLEDEGLSAGSDLRGDALQLEEAAGTKISRLGSA